jgi:succinyl-diaminopimelate desuccinylase
MIGAMVLAASLTAVKHFDAVESKRLVPMLTEAVAFPTVEHDTDARQRQQAWLVKTATEMSFVVRDAGLVTEIELPAAAPDAPVLGLVVHGDVQPVDADAWSSPPFTATVKDGAIIGRGVADDKGPLVQALLAMKALKETHTKLTHTIRLLVGSDEESVNEDIKSYLATHKAPDYSLVLDSGFPVIVGEKAWNALAVATKLTARGGGSPFPYEVKDIHAGLATSIVPDNAEVVLHWSEGAAQWDPIIKDLQSFRMPEGTRLVVAVSATDPSDLRVVAYGHSAHAGVNLEGGRNALVALAKAVEGKLPPGGGNDLLAFARLAGSDIHGSGLGFKDNDPIWGTYAVNVATVKADDAGRRVLTINIRSIPPLNGAQRKERMEQFVAAFNTRTGSELAIDAGSFWGDEPLGFNPNGKLVSRLLADYGAATGVKNPKPAISGGGTYAKRLPNSIAFGMWFPDKPYPGHDVNETNPIDDLMKGTRILIRTLADIGGGARIEEPFR